MLPRFQALIAKVTGTQPGWTLLGDGWKQMPLSTPDELNDAIEKTYDGLYSDYLNDQQEYTDYQMMLEDRQALITEKGEYAASLSKQADAIQKLQDQTHALEAEKSLRVRANTRLTKEISEIEAHTLITENEAIGWIEAALPQSLDAQTWQRWRPDSEADNSAAGEHNEVAPAYQTPIPGPDGVAVPAIAAQSDPDPKAPLPDGLDDRMTAVEHMADIAYNERQLTPTEAADQAHADVEALRAEVANDEGRLREGAAVQNSLYSRAVALESDVRSLTITNDVNSRDFAAAAVLDWVWGNASAVVAQTIRREVSRSILAASGGRTSLEIGDEEVDSAIRDGRTNIFWLPDQILKIKKLMDVVGDVRTLANHTGDYAQAVARYAALGSPSELEASMGANERRLGHDVWSLQHKAVSAAGLREPFASAWLHMVAYEAHSYNQ